MSWTNLKFVEECQLDNGQRGVCARTDIPEGVVVGIYDGIVVQYKLDEHGQITDPDAHKEAIQLAVEADTVYGLVTPPGAPCGGIDYLNHSCRPNIVVRHQIVLVASRDISKDEPLTADYRTWDLVPYRETCWCPVPRCVI